MDRTMASEIRAAPDRGDLAGVGRARSEVSRIGLAVASEIRAVRLEVARRVSGGCGRRCR